MGYCSLHLELKHIAFSLFLAIITGLLAGFILINQAQSQPYLEYQFTDEEKPFKQRATDLIKSKIEFEWFLKKLSAEETGKETAAVIETFCNSMKSQMKVFYCVIETEQQDKNWVVAMEIFYDSFSIDKYGLVMKDGKYLYIRASDSE